MRILFFAALFAPSTALAGAWTQAEGGAFLKAGSRLVQADEFYSPDGDPTQTATLNDALFSIYAEYGLFDDLTVIGNLPIRRLTVNRQVGALTNVVISDGDSVTALGDAEVAARYRLGRVGRTVFSLQGTVGLPVGLSGEDNTLVTGDGEADVRGELLVGHSFRGLPIYLTSNVGFAQRFRGFSDEFRYGVEAGWAEDWGVVLLRANGIQSFKNGDDSSGTAEANLFANNASFLAVGPEVTVNVFDGIGVSAAAETVVFGENVFRAPAFTFGLVYSR